MTADLYLEQRNHPHSHMSDGVVVVVEENRRQTQEGALGYDRMYH